MHSNTLAEAIYGSRIGFDDLHKNYRPMLRMVDQLIGVVPNCDPYLEIWPTGFRTYNLLVPNLLNIPGSLLGQGAPKDMVGLAMYVSSRAADCMYCSAHTCSFALRRGTTPEALVGDYSPSEAAVAAVAEGMSRVPDALLPSVINEARKYLDESDLEWVVLSAALMGFLNKFMDTMGIELEQSAIDDVSDLITDTGWSSGKHAWSAEDIDGFGVDDAQGSPLGATLPAAPPAPSEHEPTRRSFRDVPKDSVGTYLRVLRAAPGAIRKDRQWKKGMASSPAEALLQLEDRLGTAYSTLGQLTHGRAVQAIATVVRDNLDAGTTTLGLSTKCLIALVYARVVGNDHLTAEAIQMAERLAPELHPTTVAAVGRFADTPADRAALPAGLSVVEAAAVLLARSAAPSPSEVNQITIDTATHYLSPQQIVEAVVWLSVQQLLHRLYVYFDAELATAA
jgi:alkylhydroperoxidase family enzyme